MDILNRIINRWLVVMGVLAVIFGAALWYFRDSKGNASYYEGSNTVKLCEYIEIDMLKTNVHILPYQGEKIKIEYKSIVPISVMLGDNRLVITESDEFVLSFLTGDPEQFGLWLYLPKGIYKDIAVSTTSGKAEIGRIDSEDVTVITKSGSISATETRSLVSLVTGSGDILLDFEHVIAGSSIESRKGNAEITFPKGSSVALAYETETGTFNSDILKGSIEGSYMYSFSGGENLISADIESGTLTVNERKS